MNKKTGLGRGLDALISFDENSSFEGTVNSSPSSISEIAIDKIHPNPTQPRHEFDETALDELSASIRNIGIIQPITLREEQDGTYMIIAGERRWRAAQRAGLESIPAYIRKVDDDTVMEMALIENIQREDLNAIEVALAYQQLIENYHLTHEDLSQRVGKNRTTITNFIRLLKLPAEIQLGLKEKRISQGHARAILPVEDSEQQIKLYHLIIRNEISVRKVEALVKDYTEGRILDFDEDEKGKRPKATASPNELIDAMTRHLSQMFASKVKMSCNEHGKGHIQIQFDNDEQLQHILALLDGVSQA